jgi:hypothetical protein
MATIQYECDCGMPCPIDELWVLAHRHRNTFSIHLRSPRCVMKLYSLWNLSDAFYCAPLLADGVARLDGSAPPGNVQCDRCCESRCDPNRIVIVLYRYALGDAEAIGLRADGWNAWVACDKCKPGIEEHLRRQGEPYFVRIPGTWRECDPGRQYNDLCVTRNEA